MQPLDDRTTCYTLIFWYFETADPTRPDPRVDPTRVQLWPDHSGQPQWEVSRCYSSLLSELAGGSLPDDSCPLHLQYRRIHFTSGNALFL